MQKSIIRLALITAGILTIPLISMQFENGADWTVSDFVFAGALIFGIGLAYILISRRSGTTQYKLAVGLGLAGAFFLVWVSGAVGIIGDPEDGTADLPNLMYFCVLAIGSFGSILSRFNPRGMSLTLFAAAAVQFVVPFIVFAINRPLLDDAPGMMGVFILNSAFAMLFAGSGMLFSQAEEKKA